MSLISLPLLIKINVIFVHGVQLLLLSGRQYVFRNGLKILLYGTKRSSGNSSTALEKGKQGSAESVLRREGQQLNRTGQFWTRLIHPLEEAKPKDLGGGDSVIFLAEVTEVVKKLDRCGKELIYQFVILTLTRDNQLWAVTKVADFRGQNQVDPERGWMPQGHLPLKVFWPCLGGQKHWGKSRTHWESRTHISRLAWECLAFRLEALNTTMSLLL